MPGASLRNRRAWRAACGDAIGNGARTPAGPWVRLPRQRRHELGTPLGTIAVVAREWSALAEKQRRSGGCASTARTSRALPRHHRGSPIPKNLAGRDRPLPLGAFLGRYRRSAPGRGFGNSHHRVLAGRRWQGQVGAPPNCCMGWENIIENAADFAKPWWRSMPVGTAVSLHSRCRTMVQALRGNLRGAGANPTYLAPGHHALGETENRPARPLDQP